MLRYLKKITQTLCLAVMLSVLLLPTKVSAESKNLNVACPNYNFKTTAGSAYTNDTNSGKTKLIVFIQCEGCLNSSHNISEIANAEWLSNKNLSVVAVDISFFTANELKEYANTYAPGCKNITFASDTSRSAFWNFAEAAGFTGGTMSSTVTYIVDSNNKIRYCQTNEVGALTLKRELSKYVNGIEAPAEANLSITGTFHYEKAFEVLTLVNQERAKENLPALKMNTELLEGAMLRATECSLYYNHTRPSGESWATVGNTHAGFLCGENIAAGQITAAQVMNDWMNSPGHRANILKSDVTEIGIGCFCQDGLYYWVQNYGKNYTSAVAAKSSAKEKTVTVRISESNLKPYISNTSISLAAGKGKTISVYAEEYFYGDPVKINGSSLKFTSGNTAVATVSAKGYVTAVSAGSTTIKVKIPGTGYSFSVPVQVKVTSLAAPEATLKIKAANGKPKLTWNEVKNAVKYEVYRSTSKSGTYSKVYTTTGTSFTNTSTVPGKLYYYKVRAVAGDVKSAFSSVKSITCDCAQPVITISINKENGKPKLVWKEIEGASKYEIYRSTSKTGTYTKMYTTTKTSYTNTSAVVGKTYYYKVRAICKNSENGNSAYSAIKYITCDCARPVVTISLSSAGKPKLRWEAVKGAKEYEIYRATGKDGTYTKMYTTTKTSYTNTSAKEGKTYYYKVRAICERSKYGNSAYSTIKSITSK